MVWGKDYQINFKNSNSNKNRAFRIIARKNYDVCSEDILNSVGFPNLQTRQEHQLAILMYKIKHKMLPNYLIDIFTNINEIHDYSTRQSEFNFYGGPEGTPLLTNKYATNIILRISFPLDFVQNTTLN